jgi:hypothetical protein
MTDTTPTKTAKQSSGFIRVVGATTIAVVNTKQRPEDVTVKAKQSKWAVMEYVGKTKKLVGSFDKKYDAIDTLRAREVDLKAAAQNNDS